MARDDAAEYFGRALASARSERGLKRMQLKELSGLSYPYISEIENGGKYPSQRAIQALADALGMSPSELVSRAERIESEDVDSRAGEDPQTPVVSALAKAWPELGPPLVTRGLPLPAAGEDELLIGRLSAKVLDAIEGPLRDLLLREVQMTVREELLRQRGGR